MGAEVSPWDIDVAHRVPARTQDGRRRGILPIICKFTRRMVRDVVLLKAQSSNYSQDFLMSLQSCYLIPTVVKPTRERSTSATLIDNIFVNTPEKVLVSGNFISDISDHFSQFCILTSIVNQTKVESRKVRDFSKFSPGSFTAHISQVDWNEILDRDNADVDRTLSFFL